MAAATPVLERRSDASSEYTDDMQHNARIRDNYARLINPNTRLSELMGREEENSTPPPAQSYNQSEVYRANPREALFGQRVENVSQAKVPAAENTPYLVTGARADADIFRADSPINRRFVQPEQPVTNVAAEEESEDLRPTRTTIQYGTAERADNEVIPSSTVKSEEHAVNIGKREKIIIGAFVSMVIALFVLVIINSAIISGLNTQVNDAQSALEEAQNEYARVSEQIEEARSEDSIYAFALQNGMTQQQSED